MQQALMVALASLLCVSEAFSDVIIYKFSSAEQFIGGGVEKRGVVRGMIVIDLNTFDISIIGTSLINKRKEMVVESVPSVDIQTVSGVAGRTYTVLSILEQDRPASGTNLFTRLYARGMNSVVEWAPGQLASWPKRLSF